MVLTAAFEFDPRSNKEATIRPTDNIEVPQVITDIDAKCSCARVRAASSEVMLMCVSVCQEEMDCPEFNGKCFKKGRLTSSMRYEQTSPVCFAADP